MRRGSPLLALFALSGFVGCLPSPGPFFLAAREGRVVDRDIGAPIAGAWVVEWYRGAGVPGDTQPEYHARLVRTDARGRFTLPRELAPSVRMWTLRTYGPTYSFYHPDYGLVHGGGPKDDGRVQLSGSRTEAELRRLDLAPYCRGERRGDGARRLAALACPARATDGPRREVHAD